MDGGEGCEVGDDENPLSGGEAGDGGTGEVEFDSFDETNPGEVEGGGGAGVDELDVFGEPVTGRMIHDFAYHEVELGVRGIAGVGGGGEKVAL